MKFQTKLKLEQAFKILDEQANIYYQMWKIFGGCVLCPMCTGRTVEIKITPETSAATYQYCCEDCGHEFD